MLLGEVPHRGSAFDADGQPAEPTLGDGAGEVRGEVQFTERR
jgi:hypothetical protein